MKPSVWASRTTVAVLTPYALAQVGGGRERRDGRVLGNVADHALVLWAELREAVDFHENPNRIVRHHSDPAPCQKASRKCSNKPAAPAIAFAKRTVLQKLFKYRTMLGAGL